MRVGWWVSGFAVLAVLIAAVWIAWPSRRSIEAAAVSESELPARIVAIAPSTVEILYELGAGDRLVGVGRFCTHPPAVGSLPKVGGLYDPDYELILALGPDLLVTRGQNRTLEKLCRENGIRVFRDPTDSLADLYRSIRALGELSGRAPEAAALRGRMERELAAIRQRVGDRKPVGVLVTMRQGGPIGEVYTFGRGPYLNDLIEIAGGRNVFGDLETYYPQVGAEEILARAPEVIIELRPGASADPAAVAAAREQWQRIGPIPAARTGRVYVVTEDYAAVPSPRITQMARLLAERFHPEVRFED